MMSAQNQAEQGVIQSSIALLQERFKQLQRVKEMREKKELLTMFSDNYSINNTTTNPNNTTTTNNKDGDVVDVNDDEVQIFLPPNYYYSNRKPSSCYHPSSTSSSLSSSSSVLSHNNNHNNNNLNEISLSLRPPAMSYSNATATAAAAAAEHFRRAPLPTMSTRPSSCVSSAYNKFEDSHVSDVDTTLHL